MVRIMLDIEVRPPRCTRVRTSAFVAAASRPGTIVILKPLTKAVSPWPKVKPWKIMPKATATAMPIYMTRQSGLSQQRTQENDYKGDQKQRIPGIHLVHCCKHGGNIFRHHKVTAKAQPIYGIDDDGNNSGRDRGPQHGPNMSIQISSRAQRGHISSSIRQRGELIAKGGPGGDCGSNRGQRNLKPHGNTDQRQHRQFRRSLSQCR